MNQPSGGRVASPSLAVIAIGQAASAAPQYHLRRLSSGEQKNSKNTGDAAFISFHVEICSCLREKREKKNPSNMSHNNNELYFYDRFVAVINTYIIMCVC